MTWKKRLVALIVPALVAGAVFIWIRWPENRQSFRMADGTVVTLSGVTHSISNQIIQGKPYQKLLRGVLPPKLKPWSGCQVYNYYNHNTNDPVFWMSFDKTVAAGPPIRLLDEYGCEHDPLSWASGWVLQYCYYQTTAMSPAGRTVGICFYEDTRRTNKIGQFLIPGATLTPAPAGRGLPGPQTAGDLVVELTGFTTGLTSIPVPYTMSTNTFPFTQAEFAITRGGKREIAWRPNRVRITGPQGEGVPSGMIHQAFRNDDFILNFERVLDPALGPFKLRVELVREFDFPPDELVTLAHVPFPSARKSVKPGIKTEFQGKTVAIDEVYAADSERPASPFLSTEMMIAASISPAERGLWLKLIRAVDEQGGELPVAGVAPVGDGSCYFALQPFAFATSMDLTFAVHRSRYVTFEATPVWFTTNSTSGRPGKAAE